MSFKVREAVRTAPRSEVGRARAWLVIECGGGAWERLQPRNSDAYRTFAVDTRWKIARTRSTWFFSRFSGDFLKKLYFKLPESPKSRWNWIPACVDRSPDIDTSQRLPILNQSGMSYVQNPFWLIASPRHIDNAVVVLFAFIYRLRNNVYKSRFTRVIFFFFWKNADPVAGRV